MLLTCLMLVVNETEKTTLQRLDDYTVEIGLRVAAVRDVEEFQRLVNMSKLKRCVCTADHTLATKGNF